MRLEDVLVVIQAAAFVVIGYFAVCLIRGGF